MMNEQEVLAQSRGAFAQWGPQWEDNARKNGVLYRRDGRSQKDILNIGMGKMLLCVAAGYSFERDIEVIKKYSYKFDIACVDKSFSSLMDNGLKPKYVVLADANIPFTYAEKYIDQTEDIYLIANVTASVEWTHAWKGPIIFYVNKDNIKTEEIYGNISGCRELIPASSNVGNTVIVFFTQIGGYDQYVLTGYDYAWGQENYYAFGDSDKRHWMRHLLMIGVDGKLCYTSSNLNFSARWMHDYMQNMIPHMRVFNCSGSGILPHNTVNLEQCLAAFTNRTPSPQEWSSHFSRMIEKRQIPYSGAENLITEISKHKIIAGVEIHYLPDNITPKPEEVLQPV